MGKITSNWFSVQDVMPGEKNKEVLIRYVLVEDDTCDLFGMGTYIPKNGYWDICFNPIYIDYRVNEYTEDQVHAIVTHWAPIPEFPYKEASDLIKK